MLLRNLTYVILIGLFFCMKISVSKKKEIDFDALEKAWEEGDEKEELNSDTDMLYRQTEEKLAQSSGNKPQMFFVSLDSQKEWNQESLSVLATKWKEMLFNGGYEVNCYNIEESKIMIAIQKGWDAKYVKDFLLIQPEIVEFEWNNKKFHTHREL